MLNQSLCLSHKGEQWTGQLLMWIFCPSMDSEQSVASVCQLQMSCHVTSWHRDILMTSQTQTSLVELLARIASIACKFQSISSSVMMVLYRVTRSEGWVWWYSLCFIVPLTPTIYSSPGASVCRPVLDCNWTLWPPISEYHRDHVMIVTPAPATLLCPLRMAIQWSEWSEWYQHQQWQLWSGDTSHPD